MKGVIFDIKRYAIHDGPGIRTTVFLKGCPLRCAWCHNPESQGFGVVALPGRDGPTTVGREVTAGEVVREVSRDTLFHDESGGGVTFSGGEPLAQPEFLCELLDRCGGLSIHRAVDTCGFAPREVLLEVARRTDLFLFDLKLADEAAHRAMTGESPAAIHDNLRALCETQVAIRLRVPVIPGITDTEANLAALRALVDSLPRELPLQPLPYHAAAMDKYRRFGMPVPLPHTREPTAAAMERVRTRLAPETDQPPREAPAKTSGGSRARSPSIPGSQRPHSELEGGRPREPASHAGHLQAPLRRPEQAAGDTP